MSLPIKVLVLISLLLGACAPGTPRSTQIPRARTEASVVRSGFSIRDGRLGAGALVRVGGSKTIRDITIGITFFAGGRKVGAQQRDILPYCPPSSDCWWGQSFFGDRLDVRWASVDRAVVRVLRAGASTDRESIVSRLRFAVEGDDVVVTPAGEDGTAYLVAVRGSRPSYGISFVTRSGEHAPLRYGTESFPTDRRDRIVGAFYPGPVERPAD
ncbi:MAG TPA: hypothetical protein VFA34_17205 [Actinomycetota bacterium]|nr:hypothetical protein [Actinomycetota bacterium]